MDASVFQPDAPGTLVEIEARERAFVPAPLPPAWRLSIDQSPLLIRAHAQLARLDGMTRTLPDPAVLVRPLQQREALRSSSLEGTYATPRELLLFELAPTASHASSADTNAWREVANYSAALRHGAATVGERGLSFSLINELHKLLLTDVRGRDRTPGKFRDGQVFIGREHRFVPPPVTHLSACLHQFRDYIASPSGDHDPLVRCFLAHYQFEAIHPFLDGNGRVGRLLLSLMIQTWCETAGPWLYLSAFFDRHKDEYIDRLFSISTQNAWAEWIDFCLHATIAQATDTIDRCSKLHVLREGYRRTVQEMRGASVRLFNVVEHLFENPFVRIADLPKRLGVTYPTALKDCERLEAAGILKELPNAYPRTLYAREIFNVTFMEPEGPPSAER